MKGGEAPERFIVAGEAQSDESPSCCEEGSHKRQKGRSFKTKIEKGIRILM